MTLDPVTHDRATAAISHLPHLVADALVDAVVRMDPRFFEMAGRGFKDTTRIAASDPADVARDLPGEPGPASRKPSAPSAPRSTTWSA